MRTSNTTLRFDENVMGNWEPVELSDDPQSARRFWAVVLQFAITDNADAVVFDLDGSNNCLGVKIDGQIHFLEPPVSEYRLQLLQAALRLARGGLIRAAVRETFSWLIPSSILGRINVEIPDGDVAWDVRRLRHGVAFERCGRTIFESRRQ